MKRGVGVYGKCENRLAKLLLVGKVKKDRLANWFLKFFKIKKDHS